MIETKAHNKTYLVWSLQEGNFSLDRLINTIYLYSHQGQVTVFYQLNLSNVLTSFLFRGDEFTILPLCYFEIR